MAMIERCLNKTSILICATQLAEHQCDQSIGVIRASV